MSAGDDIPFYRCRLRHVYGVACLMVVAKTCPDDKQELYVFYSFG
jgi:hypothetical protein